MCTYQTERIEVAGSGKGRDGWFAVTSAMVYFDHPVHAPYDHALNVDVMNPALGPGARVALELDPSSARRLAESILSALDTLPAELQHTSSPSPASILAARP
jgi:hypothetical protein